MAGIYEISASAHFDAAHRLRDYEGKCARMHGHSFRVEAALAGSDLGAAQLLVDFNDLRRLLRETIEPFDHCCLNDLPPFTEISPTSENLARVIFHSLQQRVRGLAPGVRLAWVGVSESPDTRAVYREAE